MKIGILSGKIPPPVFIDQLVIGLAIKGHEVFLYGSTHGVKYKSSHKLLIIRNNLENKFILFFKTCFQIVKVIFNHHEIAFSLLSQIRENGKGFRNYFDRCSRVLPPFSDNLDIFHIQWPKALITYTEYIEHLKIPIVLSLRGTQINASPLANKLLAKSYRKYFPKVTKFHAVSNAIVKEAEKYGVDSEKVSIINPSVDEKLLEYPKHERNDEVFKIISVGRCHWIKGYTFALDAMVQLRNKGVNFHYSIIAGGRDSENIIYQINDLGLQKNVSFINGLTHDEALKKMYSSDIYLLPSVGEGISNTVLESMALGVPVISTDCGGMGEVIKNGENGFIVPVRDVKAMVRAIENFIKLDDKEKLQIIQTAQETIDKRFLLSNQIDKMELFYRNSIESFSE